MIKHFLTANKGRLSSSGVRWKTKTTQRKKKKNEMFHRVSDEFFRRAKATENGHEICLSLIHPWRLTLFSFRIATLTSGVLFTTQKNDKIKDKTGEAYSKHGRSACKNFVGKREAKGIEHLEDVGVDGMTVSRVQVKLSMIL
jgi:hypothetical protein